MARVDYSDLIVTLEKDPRYAGDRELGVPADQALYIRFATGEVGRVRTEVMELADGSDLVLDIDASGRVVGIEIV